MFDALKRKIVCFEVDKVDYSLNTAHLAKRPALPEEIHALKETLLLRGGNASTFNATIVLVMLQWPKINPPACAHASATTTRSSRVCLAPKITAQSFQSKALITSRQLDIGLATSFVCGSTTITRTRTSATSDPMTATMGSTMKSRGGLHYCLSVPSKATQ
jgi:hypothetical protein